MKVDFENFSSELIGVGIGLKRLEIDTLISALQRLKEGQDHFHFRSVDYEIKSGVLDVEIYCIDNDCQDNMTIEGSPPIWPNR